MHWQCRTKQWMVLFRLYWQRTKSKLFRVKDTDFWRGSSFSFINALRLLCQVPWALPCPSSHRKVKGSSLCLWCSRLRSPKITCSKNAVLRTETERHRGVLTVQLASNSCTLLMCQGATEDSSGHSGDTTTFWEARIFSAIDDCSEQDGASNGFAMYEGRLEHSSQLRPFVQSHSSEMTVPKLVSSAPSSRF